MNTQKSKALRQIGMALAATLLCALWACSDPREEYAAKSAEASSGGTDAPPEQGWQRDGSIMDTFVWRGDAAASFTDLGDVESGFRHEASQQVRISIIRFRLSQPAEVEVSHCGSGLASAGLLLVDSARQAVVLPGEGNLPEAPCSNPALGQLRMEAQPGVYYAVGYAAGVVQVDVSTLLGVASPAIISMQTNAVTGALRTVVACSPLRRSGGNAE